MTSIAFITGASGGIGRAVACQLHAQRCRVAAVGRDAGRLADVDAAVRIATTIAAAKGGVKALVRSAAATYASRGLRVNAVAPGVTDTPMTTDMLKMPAMREGGSRQYPLGGVQTASQVADVMAWRLGDGSARLTGQVVAVDGGFTTVRPPVK